MNGHRGLFTDGAYSKHQSRHHDVAPRGRHGEQRPLPRRPTGRYDVPPRAPSQTPVRVTTHHTARLNSRRDRDSGRDFEDPTCHSAYSAITEPEEHAWSWTAMAASITSMTLFASLFGLIGVMFASLAYADHKVGDYRRARFKTRLAWFFALFGITVTVFALVFLFIVMYALNVPRPTFEDSEYWVPPWLYYELENQ